MEQKTNKNIAKGQWLTPNAYVPGSVPGSGSYNSSTYVPKESFNMGKVPFGSFSNQQDWERTRKLTHIDDSYTTPGPGQYKSQAAEQKIVKKRMQGSPRNAQGNFGADLALKRDGSGVRLLGHHIEANKNQRVTRIVNSLGEMNPQLTASVLSLKQKGQIRGAESQRSLDINTIINNASQRAAMDFNQTPDSNQHPMIGKMLKDSSITNLMNIETAIGGQSVPQTFGKPKHGPMYGPVTGVNVDQLSPKASRRMLGNATTANKNLVNQTSAKTLLTKDTSNTDLNSHRQLGTMGLPREASQKQQTQNYLFNPSNAGAADYNPNPDFIMKSSQIAGISKIPSQTRLQAERAQEAQIEGMLKAVFPDRVKNTDLKPLTNVETFNQKEAKKQHPSFVSGSKRTDFSAINMSVPGAYEVQSAQVNLKDQRDFAIRKGQIDKPEAKPRNCDGAFLNSDAPLYAHSKYKSQVPQLNLISPLTSIGKSPFATTTNRQLSEVTGAKSPVAVNNQHTVAQSLTRDPVVVSHKSELSKAQLKKRLAVNDIPGPGAYDYGLPMKSGRRDFPDIAQTESRRFLGDIDEEFLAEMTGRKPAPGFNSGVTRFQKNRDANNKSKTMQNYDSSKPILELQQLEGPQQRLKREMLNETDPGRDYSGKAGIQKGSAFKMSLRQKNEAMGLLSGIATTANSTLHKSPSIHDMTNNAEFNIYSNEVRNKQVNYYKKELKTYMRQEEQLISFNSSSPRFVSPNSHQVRLVPGKDSISGVNFRTRTDRILGPGSYRTKDEVEQVAKNQANFRSNNAAVNAGFASSTDRQKNNFQAQERKGKGYQDHVGPGGYEVLGALQKKSYNALIQDRQQNNDTSVGYGGVNKNKFNLQQHRSPRPQQVIRDTSPSPLIQSPR